MQPNQQIFNRSKYFKNKTFIKSPTEQYKPNNNQFSYLGMNQDRRYSYNKQDYVYNDKYDCLKSKRILTKNQIISNYKQNLKANYHLPNYSKNLTQNSNSLLFYPSNYYNRQNHLNKPKIDSYINSKEKSINSKQKMISSMNYELVQKSSLPSTPDNKHQNPKKLKIFEKTFQKFLQLAKKQKERKIFIPQRSFNSTNFYKKKLVSPTNSSCLKKQHQAIQELRQTQDTLYNIQTVNNDISKLKIEDFIKCKLLGKGKNGQVYLVIHKKTAFACAMKIIKKKQINRGAIAEKEMIQNQLLREIKIQMSMSHSNIIDLYGVFVDPENIYLLQQLGLNGHLYDLMKRKNKFSEQTTALISRDVLKGLQGLHEKNIIHRDIKPQNIVLIFGVSKICDFGWSVYCPIELRKTLCGTPLYLSPEILVGEEYNEKIDIWAFGTLVYELFTGQNPFKIRSKSDLKRIVTDDIDFCENFPRRLRSFLENILKKNLHQRPTSKQIEQHEFLRKYAQIQTSEQISDI